MMLNDYIQLHYYSFHRRIISVKCHNYFELVSLKTTCATECVIVIVLYGVMVDSENSTANPNKHFIATPLPRNVTIGEEVNFLCQYSTADGIGWKINGTILNSLSLPNITVISNPLSDGGVLYKLIIIAHQMYNMTTFTCVATFLDSRLPAVETFPAILLLQGKLDGISNLERIIDSEKLQYSWEPPYSLDLTSVEPDIAYCVNIVRVTCGMRDHVISDCDVSDQNYTTNSLFDLADLYEATITPRSNVITSCNGTQVSIIDEYIFIKESTLEDEVKLDTETKNMTVVLRLNLNKIKRSQVIPDSFSALLMTVDDQEFVTQWCPTSKVMKINGELSLNLDCPLQPRRLWACVLVVSRCETHQVSDAKEISTYDIQNIVFKSCIDENTSTKSIHILGDFINETEAAGVLIMGYFTNQADLDAHYVSMVVHLSQEQPLSLHGFLSGLYYDFYNVSLFIVDNNGLPIRQAATRSKALNFSTTMNACDAPYNTAEGHEALIAVQLYHYPDRNESCIQCTFLNSSISSCVVIIQNAISFFSLTDLSTIIDVHRFDSKLDGQLETLGCLEQNMLNLTHHVLVAFAYDVKNKLMLGPAIILQKKRHESVNTGEPDLSSLVFISVAVCTLTGIVALLMFSIILCTLKRHKKRQPHNNIMTATGLDNTVDSKNIQMQKCDAYEVAPMARKNLVMEVNPAYGEIHRTV